MTFPEDLKYTPEHEWIRLEGDNIAVIGITDFAQHELGDIVYIDIEDNEDEIDQNEVFGSVEAVKTVSDLFIPVTGTIVEVNEALEDNPELVNSDPYGKGWMVKIKVTDANQLSELIDSEAYQKLIGE